jgi:DNA processing protein
MTTETTASTSMIGFDDERLARTLLTYLAEPSDERLGVLTETYGAAPVLAGITTSLLPGPAADAARRDLERWRSRLGELPTADSLERLCRQGIRLVCPGDPEWPARLDDLGASRPYALWLRGSADLRFSCLKSVAIVGSRAATAYSSYIACEIAASVAARGWTVISGAAYGWTGPRTPPRSAPEAPRSRCWRAAWTWPTRRVTRTCWTPNTARHACEHA